MIRIRALLFVLIGFGTVVATAQWVQMGGCTNVTHLAVSGSKLYAAVNTGYYNCGGVYLSTNKVLVR
jgi:hypothetical protein